MYSFIRFSLFQVLIPCILQTDFSNFNKAFSFLHILFFPSYLFTKFNPVIFLLIFAIYQIVFLILSFCLNLNCYCNVLSVCLSPLQSIFFISPRFNIQHMFSLPVCLFVCLSVCLFVCLSVFLFVCLSVCLFVCLSVCLFVCLSVCLFVCYNIYFFSLFESLTYFFLVRLLLVLSLISPVFLYVF
jgi:hypothetical protein